MQYLSSLDHALQAADLPFDPAQPDEVVSCSCSARTPCIWLSGLGAAPSALGFFTVWRCRGMTAVHVLIAGQSFARPRTQTGRDGGGSHLSLTSRTGPERSWALRNSPGSGPRGASLPGRSALVRWTASASNPPRGPGGPACRCRPGRGRAVTAMWLPAPVMVSARLPVRDECGRAVGDPKDAEVSSASWSRITGDSAQCPLVAGGPGGEPGSHPARYLPPAAPTSPLDVRVSRRTVVG